MNENIYSDKFPFIPEAIFRLAKIFSENQIIVGRYKVLDTDFGSFGDIYHCLDQITQKEVALKTIKFNKKNTEQIFRFYEEAFMRLNMCRHPNVLNLNAVEMINGYPYLVSDWISENGKVTTLGDLIRSKKRFSLAEILGLFFQICYGIQFCYVKLSDKTKTYVNGDLNPFNIFISKDHHAVIGDFSVHSNGTRGWQSPEQKNREPVDYRSDIFNLGHLLEEMMEKIENTDENIPAKNKIYEIVKVCKMKKPDERYGSYEKLLDDLVQAAEMVPMPVPQNVDHLQTSYIDEVNRIYSEINMEYPIRLNDSIGNISAARSLMNIPMVDYIEYVKYPNRILYEAEALRCSGKYDKALDLLKNRGWDVSDSLFYFIRGKVYLDKKNIDAALADFCSANEKELHLPSLNILADNLLLNTNYQTKYKSVVQKFIHRLGNYITDYSDGFLPHQVLGKMYLIIREYYGASRAFAESLNYPCYETWSNLYYYGICQINLNQIYLSTNAFRLAVREIKYDMNYKQNLKKVTTILFCFYELAMEDEALELIDYIKKNFNLDYSGIRSVMLNEHGVYNSFLSRIQVCEKESDINMWSELFDNIHDYDFHIGYLKVDLLSCVSSHISHYYFCTGEYEKGISLCKKARDYDYNNPGMLYNEGSLFYMDRRYDMAYDCYCLASFYEQNAELKARYETAKNEAKNRLG